jgi:hypothetical protein
MPLLLLLLVVFIPTRHNETSHLAKAILETDVRSSRSSLHTPVYDNDSNEVGPKI